MYSILLVVLLLIAITLIILIMLQQSRGTDISTYFDSSYSKTLFRSSGTNNFMSRMTIVFATLFFIINIILGNMSSTINNSFLENENKFNKSNINKVSKDVKTPIMDDVTK